MSNKEKDFLLFYDWYKQLMNMSAKNCKTMLRAMVEYQTEGKEPPEFPNNIKGIAELMFSQLSRRIVNAENGTLGSVARLRRAIERGSAAAKSGDAAKSAAKSPLEAPPLAYRQDIDKDTDTDTDMDTD